MRDGIELEKRGLPTAVVCTEPFIPTIRATAAAGGRPDYPYAIVSHPVCRLSREDLERRVDQAMPQILAILGKVD